MGASVTNLRKWRAERDTPRAELLESRDHSPRLVGVTSNMGRTVEWYIEPPQVRSIVVDDDVVRLAFPRILFGVQRKRSGAFASLHAFATTMGGDERPLDQDSIGDARLWLLPLPNIIGRTATVCFGHFVDEIVSGEVDPIDAFWSSRFNFDQTSNWKRPALKKWTKATKTAMRLPAASLDLSAREAFWAAIAVRAMKGCMRATETTPSSLLKLFRVEQWIQRIVSCAIAALGVGVLFIFVRALLALTH